MVLYTQMNGTICEFCCQLFYIKHDMFADLKLISQYKVFIFNALHTHYYAILEDILSWT